MHFLPDSIEEYITLHSAGEPELLQELSRETHLKVLQPRMLSGHYQGRVLSMISKLVNPRQVLEVGTYTGYSALCLAEGLHPEGELHTIDVNEELKALQRQFFDRSEYRDQIFSYTGNAIDIIPTIDKRFDLVFIDADKKNYTRYFELVIDKMNPGGIILSDNVLWSGKVAEENPGKKDRQTESIKAYNAMINQDQRVETVILPIRDGLTISRKK
ncbi:O-methyltransferase [Robertkochia aurantiaca]|uniref:O-methyltransferase n=1 Tax=Robertkochia aurantiaca TaxID=2873700 RepID=UPI001CCF547D|nr:O-methyltransferase [Robertkochia sp. 3YJGBD-33]